MKLIYTESVQELKKSLQEFDVNPLEELGGLMVKVLKSNHKLLICGNGGSAADAQHMAAELVIKYRFEGKHLPAISLTSDPSIMSAAGNDYGFDQTFAKQVKAYGGQGDLLLAITTSGNSPNVLEALKTAKYKNLHTAGLLGFDGGKAKSLCDIAICVPTKTTPRIQEVHGLLIHCLCEYVDEAYHE